MTAERFENQPKTISTAEVETEEMKLVVKGEHVEPETGASATSQPVASAAAINNSSTVHDQSSDLVAPSILEHDDINDSQTSETQAQNKVDDCGSTSEQVRNNVLQVIHYVWSLRAPIFLLALIALAPKTILLWIAIVLLIPILKWSYNHIPPRWQYKLRDVTPSYLRHSRLIRDLAEGANQSLPFILFWLYLCLAPFAVLWMFVHWVRGFLPQKPHAIQDGFVFEQNKKRDLAQVNSNFYYSRAFGIVIIAFFALGIPASFSWILYEKLGVDESLGQVIDTRPYDYRNNVWTHRRRTASKPVVMGLAYREALAKSKVLAQRKHYEDFAPTGAKATYVTGYMSTLPEIVRQNSQATKNAVLFVHLYIVSLAAALSVLFFRAWFFFPLNFLADQHEVYITRKGIRRTTFDNWFLNVLTLNRWAIGGGPDSLDWNEIKALRIQEDGYSKLHPLPDKAFKKESLTYKLLNKVAAFIDGLCNRANRGHYLVFSTAGRANQLGLNLNINLNELNRQQRASLFYSIKQWAPNILIDTKVEEELLGSTVLQDVRYTQLWFDLLTSKTRAQRQSVLSSGETLRDGAYRVEERLNSGGQATTYLASTASGDKCVLKEFILAVSDVPGALIESAKEFETEVSLLTRLDHPGIVRLIDFFTEDGRVYVVLEHVNGETLKQKVRRCGAMPEAEVAELAIKVSNVLAYLHNFDPPIVHRDVTPENILLLPDGTIKLIDFSLAINNDSKKTTDSCGKQAYTAPEQFREESCPQSDLYSLGATMYYLLTAEVPKPITVSSPGQKHEAISEKMNAIVERATQLDLNHRYENVQWMQLDLTQARSVPALY